MRIDALQELRGERAREGQHEKFIMWQEVHARVNKWKNESWYTSEEERKIPRKEGRGIRKKRTQQGDRKREGGKRRKEQRRRSDRGAQRKAKLLRGSPDPKTDRKTFCQSEQCRKERTALMTRRNTKTRKREVYVRSP